MMNKNEKPKGLKISKCILMKAHENKIRALL